MRNILQLTEDILIQCKNNINEQGESTPNFDNALNYGSFIKKFNLEPIYIYDPENAIVTVKIKKIQIK